MKKFLKVLFIIFLILLALIFLIRQIPEFNTEYTKEFSYQKFSKVEKGMTQYQVRQILGEPFKIWEPGWGCWKYSRGAGKFNWIKLGTPGKIIFDGSITAQVCFINDKVVEKDRTEF